MNNQQIKNYRSNCITIFWDSQVMAKNWIKFLDNTMVIKKCRSSIWGSVNG